MSLQPGARLGPYEILSALGAGGMGEVYRARDTKLGRDVAIKVLPDAVAGDPERLARFHREAQVLAVLNHPNIAHIYGVEDSSSTHALVMELVEGPTLGGRIVSGPIPLNEALEIAKQIAEALEAAHEQGIIHRDLKPANIKVREDGTVKVLDFGLAKAMEPAAGSSPSMSISPTITTPAMTQAGMILGTAAYMSPEQAKGRAVDARTDVWAFGVVLFEMVSGQRAFDGEDIADVLGAVVRLDPRWDVLPASVPPRVRQVLRGCLQKNVKARLAHIQDVRLALEGAFETAAPQTTGTATQPAPASTRRLPWAVAAGMAVIAVVASAALWRSTRPVEQVPRPLVRLDVDLGADVSLDSSTAGAHMILSPDGARIVYVSQGRLWTRRLDQPAATELAGTQGAYAPFFSPDGRWVAFFTQGSLRKVSVEGGTAIVLTPAGVSRGGSWGEDDHIIASLSLLGGLSRIPSGGGPPSPVTDIQPGEFSHIWPQVLLGGKAVLFTTGASTGYDAANIDVVSVADHRRKTLVHGGTFGRYLPSGHLVYVNRGTLFAVPFDVDRLEVHGTPVPVLEQVGYSTVDGSAQLAFSHTGTLLYRGGGVGGGLLTVVWLDDTGKVQPLLAKPRVYGRPSLSPDGQRLALDVSDGSSSFLGVYDWPRDRMSVIVTGGAVSPVWSPDGQYLVFRTVGATGMSVIRADGAGQPQPVTQSKNIQYPYSFTPDGKRLAFLESSSGTFDLWTVPLEIKATGLRGGKPEVFLNTSADERAPAISPDGRWMAYASDDSGTFQVYVRAFPDTGGKAQISDSDGTYPMWSRTGHELLFETLDGHIMVAHYAVKGESFVADKPRVWSAQQLGGSINTARNVDLAPDGRRIVALMPVETADSQKARSQVTFLENFFDDVRRKVSVGK